MLQDEIRKVCFELELLSSGATQAWNPSGRCTGEPDDRLVALVIRAEEPLHEHYLRRFEACRGDVSRRRVIEAAREELEAYRKRQAPAGETATLEELIVQDNEGASVDLVASRFRIYPALVRRIRMRAGRDPETGKAPGVTPDEEWLDHARALRAEGLSLRQIGLCVGRNAMAVQRALAA